MGTLRKIAREAVIFILLGPVVAAGITFAFVEKQSVGHAKAEAERAVYASDVKSLPSGLRWDNTVLVPLTNGTQLQVMDCSQAHPSPAFDPNKSYQIAPADEIPVPVGASNGVDCMYFTDEVFKERGGHLDSVPLGDKDQVAIEEQYWQAYAKAKTQSRTDNAMVVGFLSLWGFLGGFIVWMFYRLIRFAVKG